MNTLRINLTFVLSFLCLSELARAATESQAYTAYYSGTRTDIKPEIFGGVLLVGGGEDQDDAMQWILDRAGRGNVVILSASGEDGYNAWLLAKGAHSVESIIFHSREAASDPYILNQIANAELIFLAGGDQSFYVNFWQNTPLSELINAKVQGGMPIGGTSAGLAVLGEFVYAAQKESAQSADVLLNPYHPDVTLDRNFFTVAPLQNLITDSHFMARNRMGRLITFLSRIAQDNWLPLPRGLGIDEESAVAIDSEGRALLFGKGNAYFFTTQRAPTRCIPGAPLIYQDISVFKMGLQSTFDFGSFKGSNGETFKVSANNGNLEYLTSKFLPVQQSSSRRPGLVQGFLQPGQ